MMTETKPGADWSADLPGDPGRRRTLAESIFEMGERIRTAFRPAPGRAPLTQREIDEACLRARGMLDGGRRPGRVATEGHDDGPDANPGVLPEHDPATPQLRAKLMRRLLVAAVGRYEETLAAARLMDSAYPVLALPKEPLDEAERAERRAWRRLVDQFDDDFNNAELALASRIQNLYADLALEGRAVDVASLGDFFERAVRFGGTTYILTYDVQDYEPDTNCIAILRDGRAFDLAGEGEAGDVSP